MNIFESPLSLDQEVLARGKRGKITGVVFTAVGMNYLIAFPIYQDGNGKFLYGSMDDGDVFPAVDVSPVLDEISAPHGLKYMLMRLDMFAGESYYGNREDFISAADTMLREKRPYHGYKWDASKGRYVLVQRANYPYQEL